MICKKHLHIKAPYLCPICLVEERDELAHLVNSLASIIIDGVSSNDLDVANDAIDRVVPLLKGDFE